MLRSRENHVENKNFLGGVCPQTPLETRSGFAARRTCLRHVQGDYFWRYIIFRFFLCYSVSCLILVYYQVIWYMIYLIFHCYASSMSYQQSRFCCAFFFTSQMSEIQDKQMKQSRSSARSFYVNSSISTDVLRHVQFTQNSLPRPPPLYCNR